MSPGCCPCPARLRGCGSAHLMAAAQRGMTRGVPAACTHPAAGDYPEAQYGGGSGRCVECNTASTAASNDCAFLIE